MTHKFVLVRGYASSVSLTSLSEEEIASQIRRNSFRFINMTIASPNAGVTLKAQEDARGCVLVCADSARAASQADNTTIEWCLFEQNTPVGVKASLLAIESASSGSFVARSYFDVVDVTLCSL